MTEYTWQNWSGSVSCTPSRIEEPASEAEISELVAAATARGQQVRVVGSGHSFVPLCATNDLLISLDRHQGLVSTDLNQGLATVHAGTKIHQMGEPLWAAGLAMSNMGDIDRQSIAGAISTGTHGTGPTLGNIASQVEACRIITGDGSTLEVSRKADTSLWQAAALALGSFGVISSVTLRVLPAYKLHEQSWIEPFDVCMGQLDEHIQATRHFEFFWVPEHDVCACKALNPTERTRVPSSKRPKDTTGRLARYINKDRIDASYRIFPSDRDNRFNEIEFAVPAEVGMACLAELRQLMQRHHPDVAWPIEYRTLAADDLFLSPAYQRPTVTISLHQAADLPYTQFFADAEAIFRTFGGRPHWGKIHTHTQEELAKLYPEWKQFHNFRLQVDPEGYYTNEYLDRVFGLSSRKKAKTQTVNLETSDINTDTKTNNKPKRRSKAKAADVESAKASSDTETVDTETKTTRKPKRSSKAKAAEVKSTEVKSVEASDGTETVDTETKTTRKPKRSSKVKAAEVKSAEVKSVEASGGNETVDTETKTTRKPKRSSKAKAAEVKSAEVKSVEASDGNESVDTETKTTRKPKRSSKAKAAEVKAAEVKAAEVKSVEASGDIEILDLTTDAESAPSTRRTSDDGANAQPESAGEMRPTRRATLTRRERLENRNKATQNDLQAKPAKHEEAPEKKKPAATNDVVKAPVRDAQVDPLPDSPQAEKAERRDSSRPIVKEVDHPEDVVMPQQALAPVTLEELPDLLQKAAANAGWTSLMPVQAQSIPYIMARQDLMVQSRTGSGKTGAFLLPIIERVNLNQDNCQALILVPTRELAQQVFKEAELLRQSTGIRSVAVYGGVGYGPQNEALEKGAHVVVGTPGRILDHLLRRTLRLDNLKILVMDEADRMLSMGFYPDMREVQRYMPNRRINAYMFSATFPSNVMRLAKEFLTDPEFLSLSKDRVHVADADHVYYQVPSVKKDRSLIRLIETENPASAIIFCNTKNSVHYVAVVLQRFGYDADEISSDLNQKDRDQVLERVRAGKLRFLVATDVAARGIDIPELSHVFQYELPDDPESYIHRAGRTARAGASGVAISLVENIAERMQLERIAKRYSIEMRERDLPDDEQVTQTVSERVTTLLEAKLRDRDKLHTERMQRFAPQMVEWIQTDEGKALLAMLVDDFYQSSLHTPLVPPEETAAQRHSRTEANRGSSNRGGSNGGSPNRSGSQGGEQRDRQGGGDRNRSGGGRRPPSGGQNNNRRRDRR